MESRYYHGLAGGIPFWEKQEGFGRKFKNTEFDI